MSAEEFSIPRSSSESLLNIIVGYTNISEEASLDDVSNITGINKTTISGNNQFLSDIGILEGGNSKKVSNVGKKLGRAIEHRQENDIKKYLQDIISGNDFLSNLVTTVRVRKGMSYDELTDHILYVSGQSNNKKNKTGSRAIIDIMEMAAVIKNNDGQLIVPTKNNSSKNSEQIIEEKLDRSNIPSQDKMEKEDTKKNRINVQTQSPSIAINIQLQLPESDNAEVYENLFKSLRRYLINGEE